MSLLVSVTPSSAQDWRTSSDDPCACTDSVPFIIGRRPPVTTEGEIAAMVRDSAADSCRVSRLAVEALRDANHPSATEALVTALPSKACAIRASAAYSLIRHRSNAIAPALTRRLLSDDDRRVRQAGAYALGRHPYRAANPMLVKLLADSSKHVRLAAVEALGRLGDATVRDEVAALTSDPEPHVRQAVAEALQRIGG